mmetsp:Transcript_16778/g.41937  ORF Transcript_16778/g.41937 Transcript_16778/m.41937 type:complete len:264 (-) Transcript_16778:15-806(-)
MGTVWTVMEESPAFPTDVELAAVFPFPLVARDALEDSLPAILLAPESLFSSSIFFFTSILRRILATPTYFFFVVGSAAVVDAVVSSVEAAGSIGASTVFSFSDSTFSGSASGAALGVVVVSAAAEVSVSGVDVVAGVVEVVEAEVDFLPYRRCLAARIRAAFEFLVFFSSGSAVCSPFTYFILLFAFSKIRLRRASACARAASLAASASSFCSAPSASSLSSTVSGSTGIGVASSSAILSSIFLLWVIYCRLVNCSTSSSCDS